MRRARRQDGNHGTLRSRFEAIGGTWEDIVPWRSGLPDAMLGLRGITELVEVKDPNQPPNKRKLRPEQERFRREWRGRPVRVVETFEEIAELFGMKVNR